MGARIGSVQPVLMSRDVAASVAFYGRLGFRLRFQDTPDTPRYAGVARDAVELHLQWQGPEQWACTHDRPTYRFAVDDVEALHAEFRAAGALADDDPPRGPWSRPADTPWGTREFHVRDPDGNGLQFYRPL